MRFADENGWIEVEPLTAEQENELRVQHVSTFVMFPEAGEAGVRLNVNDGEVILRADKTMDKENNVARVDVRVFDTVGFGTELYLKSVTNIGGYKIGDREIKNTKEDKLEKFKDAGFTAWAIEKIKEARAEQVKQYGSDSSAKNS